MMGTKLMMKNMVFLDTILW